MLFNTLDYFVFLPIVFILFWFVFNRKIVIQNALILTASYIFYGWWDWRFLSLIFISTIIDYSIGLKIYRCNDKKVKRRYLWVSFLFNLGLLGYFKYFNFFIDSWIQLVNFFGFTQNNTWALNVILPVGISFYTFQTMSYSLDIYFKKLKPTKDFISFAAYVSFFPQLVAGPIERASNLLPQILSTRMFSYKQGVQGLRLILWGLFKKIVIADSLAWRVDYCFNHYHSLDGGVLFLGLIYFSIQIYCDFSGYSDIAIGTAKLFGIELISNFKFPYFSRDLAEFWRRWHISLSSWFRDYIYIPMGGSKQTKWISIRNIFIIFIVSGFWHGANFTFIAWGIFHAIFFIPLYLNGKNRIHLNNNHISSLKELLQVMLTFILVTISWVFFRSENIIQSFDYLYSIVFQFSIPNTNRSGLIFVLILCLFEFSFQNKERNVLNYKNQLVRYLVYIIMAYFIISHIHIYDNSQFIYFQF